MKKIISLVLSAVLLVGMVFALVSCGGDIADGVYKAGASEIEIDGNKIKMETPMGFIVVGKYSVDGDKITIEYDSLELSEEMKEIAELAGTSVSEAVENLEKQYADALAEEFAGTYDFEETDNGFKMDGLEYKKQ